MRKNSFPPAGAEKPEILILGSMPGEASLAARGYYAHPRNAFWPIMGAVFGAGPDIAYEARMEILARHKVAVWDSLQSCIREGSLDTAIRDAVPNDFSEILGKNTKVRHIFFNGTMAETAFRKFVLPTIDYRGGMTRLPSTSPAHAGRSMEDKIKIWKNALEKFQG